MTEQIYNIFLYFDNKEVCARVGYKTHEFSGSDADALKLLRANLEADLSHASILQLDKPFTRAEYTANQRLGQGHFLIEQLFQESGAGPTPLFVITPVVKGSLHFNHTTGVEPLDMNHISAKMGARGTMPDWLVKYTTPEGIDLPSLIHDDYFLAIKLMFKEQLYVSAMKLLVSCIDSVAYIEFGDQPGTSVFAKWLDAYADLSPLGITGSELWELRNGLLHMTSLNSKKVLASKERRISFRVGGDASFATAEAGVYYFEFKALIDAFSMALGRWISSYNNDRSKFPKFVERYDQTISDSRLAIAHAGSAGGSAAGP